jgi:REP-associated tyrosine transposase
MILSPVGKIAMNIWKIIPYKHFYVELDEMIIMPDHLHGILHLDHEYQNTGDAMNRVSTYTENNIEKPNIGGITGYKNPMLTENLSRVIRWYKGRVKYETTKMNLDFKWHSRFHDRILRLENDELNIKRNYIRNNPKNWNYKM